MLNINEINLKSEKIINESGQNDIKPEKDDFDFMELCDDTYSHIQAKQQVQNFLILKGFIYFSQFGLILKPKETKRLVLQGTQEQSTLISDKSNIGTNIFWQKYKSSDESQQPRYEKQSKIYDYKYDGGGFIYDFESELTQTFMMVSMDNICRDQTILDQF
ncbi:hypothetical protein PPERSA_01731 [Pseudocohnilembus persalinus]|uniref:Uncharacterized protein n=1 Tax=Pseudocohnilembus persalinus TaxID=266149 RepID=A0A0V0R166_PSEPJ|nr:hypothetical protein PPERSA_01731 [Pseudocohnilembus persalinus]|eukprot:KRX08270.1 hypothetical protein PPERSA_01731 [Pseudocohnilembus persalinus]